MALSKIDLTDLEDKVVTSAKKAFNRFSKDIADGLYECYASAIDYFYSGYSPKYYHRTYSLYEAASTYNFKKNQKSILRSFKSNGNPGYLITMEIDPKYIQGDPYNRQGQTNDSNRTEWVFDRAFYNIIHGFTDKENTKWARQSETKEYKKKMTDPNGVFYYQTFTSTTKGWINRFNEPSKWIEKKTVPTNGGSFNVRFSNPFLKGTSPKKEKHNLIYMVQSNYYNLRDEVKTFKRFYEYFDKELSKIKR